MNIRDLRYLIAVAELRHVGQAADRCSVSQPTLSAQIRKLEGELDVVLFERNNRSVAVTPAGEVVVAQARKALEQVDLVAEVAQSTHDPLTGVLRLGAIPTIAPDLLRIILSPLQSDYPDLDLVFSEDVTAVLIRQLLDHQLDMIVMATEVTEPDLLSVPLFDEPFWVVHHRDHEFYELDDISLKEVRKEEIITLSEEHCLSTQIRALFPSKDFTQRTFRASSQQTLFQLVSARLGCALVPALSISNPWMTDMGIVVLRIRDAKAFRRVSLVTRRTFTRPESVEELKKVIINQLPNTVRAIATA